MKAQTLALMITISLISLACQSAKRVSVPLTKTRWALVELQGKSIIHPGTNQEVRLEFSPSGNRFIGSTGCNHVFGKYESAGEHKMRFIGIGSTRRSCPNMRVERDFIKALEATNAYTIAGRELMLQDGLYILARFRVELSQ
ncbi:META domain-containing protein [Spirosoma koreense]